MDTYKVIFTKKPNNTVRHKVMRYFDSIAQRTFEYHAYFSEDGVATGVAEPLALSLGKNEAFKIERETPVKRPVGRKRDISFQ